MIGFLVWNTGNSMYPVVFAYASDREHCKRVIEDYFRESPIRGIWYRPDNWTIEPVTSNLETVSTWHVIAPRVN